MMSALCLTSSYFCILLEWPRLCFELGDVHNITRKLFKCLFSSKWSRSLWSQLWWPVLLLLLFFSSSFFCWCFENIGLFPQHHLITGNFHGEQTKGLFYLSIMLLRGENSLMQMKIIKAFWATINRLNICLCKNSTQPSETAAYRIENPCLMILLSQQLKYSVWCASVST